MGASSSRRNQPNAPSPQMQQYGPPMVDAPSQRPVSPVMPPPPMSDPSSLNRRQQRQLEDANRRIQTLQNQMQRGGGMGSSSSYGGPPMMNAQMPYGGSSQPPPMPYNTGPNTNQYSGYPPPSPLLQRLSNQSPYSIQPQGPFGPSGYRDSDYAAVANISGLNPSDVALLHREYLNLTRGGTNKFDRVVFRQLLREALVEANNENIDRAIENIFISIDRNRDGFIDFPEFVGAFRDVLRTGATDPQSFLAQYGLPDLINDQARVNAVNPPYVGQPFPSFQQPQIISIPSSNTQQMPLMYGGSSPLVISLDANQSPYVVNTQGQPLTGQPTTLQCVSLPMM